MSEIPVNVCASTRLGGVPCDRSAVYIVEIKCKTCPRTGRYSVCVRCADDARRGETHGCPDCGEPVWGIDCLRIETLVTS